MTQKIKSKLLIDSPIERVENDQLNYKPFAEKVRKIIQKYSINSEPLVIGIYGEWGMGKTSFANLIERDIDKFKKNSGEKGYIKVKYNPWIYQSKEEMLYDFFHQLSIKLGLIEHNKDAEKASKFIEKYGRYLKAIKISASVGLPMGIFKSKVTFEPSEILNAISKDKQGDNISLSGLKDLINTSLDNSNLKVLIFIDDIDRLDKDEIYTLFKLVKVIADFNNLVFIICLDNNYVSDAIYSRYGDNKEAGQKFLEKIINIPIQLPLISNSRLGIFLKNKLKQVLNNYTIREDEMEELLSTIDGQFFNNPREIIRLLNSFSLMMSTLEKEINIHDLFWIEYIKVLHEEVYTDLKTYIRSNISNIIFDRIITLENESFFNFNNEKEESMRDKVGKIHPNLNMILDFIFPKLERIDDQNSRYLRINDIEHIEKYFSFNIEGQLSELKFQIFINNIIENKTDNGQDLFEEFLIDNIQPLFIDRLKLYIKSLDNKDNWISLSKFLIYNLHKFNKKDRGNSQHSILTIIYNKINSQDKVDELIKKHLIDNIDIKNLIYFVGLIREKDFSKYNELISHAIQKVKEFKEPFYKSEDYPHIIHRLWSKTKMAEYKIYIQNSLNNKTNIISFLQTFTLNWLLAGENGEINGMFDDESLQRLKNTGLNVMNIRNKILDVLPEYRDITFETEKWNNFNENTGEDNIEQFLYYTKDLDINN